MTRFNFTKTQKREMAVRSGGVCEAGKWGTYKMYGMADADVCHRPAKIFDHVTPTELSQRPVTVDDGLHVCDVHNKVKTHGRDRPMIQKAKDIREKNMGITHQKKIIPGSRKSPFKRKFNGTVERRT